MSVTYMCVCVCVCSFVRETDAYAIAHKLIATNNGLIVFQYPKIILKYLINSCKLVSDCFIIPVRS